MYVFIEVEEETKEQLLCWSHQGMLQSYIENLSGIHNKGQKRTALNIFSKTWVISILFTRVFENVKPQNVQTSHFLGRKH